MNKHFCIQSSFNNKSPTYSQHLVLESRLVFDGAMVATAVEAQNTANNDPIADHASVAATVPSEPTINLFPEITPQAIDYSPNPDITGSSPAFPTAINLFSSIDPAFVTDIHTEQTTAIIVVDPRAENAVWLSALPPANTQIIVLDTARDGFQQVAELLQNRQDVTELHVLPWIQGDQQWLGSQSLTTTLDSSVSSSLMDWNDGLADHATLVFHGQISMGTDWLTSLSALTDTQTSWSPETDFNQVNSTPLMNTSAATNLVFIDSAVQNSADIVSAIDSGTEIIYLDASKDGLTQIADYLEGRSGIASIQIISHSKEAALYLGNDTLNNDNLASHAAQLATIGQSLTVGGDILLYGCELAKSTDGSQFVDTFSYLTHADVAASIDNTGAASKGGNWTLEYTTGTIEASILAASHYQDILALPIFNATGITLLFNDPIPKTGNGLNTGNVVVFNNVANFGGQAIDAVVTTVDNTNINITGFDSVFGTTLTPPPNTNLDWFALDTQSTLPIVTDGAASTIKFEFIIHGTYDAITGTGSDVLLQNVTVNSYDIDNAQYQEFSGFSSYTLAATTNLKMSMNGNFVHFSEIAVNPNNTGTPGTVLFDEARISIFYKELNTFQIKTGSNNAIVAHFYFDFSPDPAWTTPPPVTHNVPIAVNDTNTGVSGQPVIVDAVFNDTDLDSNPGSNSDIDRTTVKIVNATEADGSKVVAGQGTWSVNAITGEITFTPLAGFTADPTPISYTVNDKTGLTSNTATVTVDYPQTPPTTVADSKTGVSGQPVIVDVVFNDTDPENDIDRTTVKIVNATEADGSKVVAGQGTWSVNAITGEITFTPLAGFTADPTPISYTVNDKTGLTSNTATVTVDYPQTPPTTVADSKTGVSGQPVIVDVVFNDTDPENDIDRTTVKIVNATEADGSKVVAGQGTWSVNAITGEITFTPLAGFTADPTPISYTVNDKTGLTSNAATITVNYPQTPPTTVADSKTGINGQPVIIDVVFNDTDPENDIDPTTVKIVGTANAGDPLVVAGEGTWSVNTITGEITFTPIAGFTASPTVISYTVKDTGGLESAAATVTVTMNNKPIVVNDSATGDRGNPITINVLNNDSDSENNLDPTTVKIVGTANAGDPLVIAGEGTWSVDANTGAITFTPIAGFNGNPTPISYTVKDTGGLESAAATVTVTVNDLPIAIPDNNTAIEGGGLVTGNVITNEAALGDRPTIVMAASQGVTPINIGSVFITAAGGILILNVNGSYSYTPPPQGNVPIDGLTETFNYTIIDSNGDTSSSVLTISVERLLGTSGSLIQLSNPQTAINFDQPNLFVAQPLAVGTVLDLSLYIPARDDIVSFTGSLRDQVVLELKHFSFDIPAGAFFHTNPSEQLVYEASYPDGSGLPDWLRFNPKLLKFSGIPPKGAHDETVMVTATDSYGNEAHAIFTVHVNKERARPDHKSLNIDLKLLGIPDKALEKHQHKEKPVGGGSKAGLSERIHTEGKLGKLQESRLLLNSLKHL